MVDEIPSDAALPDQETGDGYDYDYNPESVLEARNRLVALSSSLASNSPSGKFISRKSDKVRLQKSINELEALVGGGGGGALPSASAGKRGKELMLGDWTLVATASLPSSDIRRRFDDNDGKGETKKKRKGWKGGWFGRGDGMNMNMNKGGVSLNPIQNALQKTVEVTQRIRNDGNGNGNGGDAGEINRVDNVIEITPLDTLGGGGIVPKDSPLFDLLGGINVNPLGVKKSKVVLVHDAEVESSEPILRTKIKWVSSILNVAGTSQFLEPDGEDVFGVNNFLGGGGTFDTPFVDEDVRVSRTSGPVLEQLRVFVRSGSSLLDDKGGMMDSLEAELRVEEEMDEAGKSERTDVGARARKVADATATMAENARSAIEEDMEGVTSALGDTMDDVVGKVQDAVEGDLEEIGKAIEGVRSSIRGEGGDSIGEALAEVTRAVAKVPTDVRDIVEEDVSDLADEVEGALDAMVADVQDSVEKDLKDIGEAIEEIRDLAAGTDDAEDKEAK